MAWDRSIPATSSALASSPIRANFQAIDQSLMGANLVRDPYFIIWPLGDTSAPAHWKTTGSPTINRQTSAGTYKTKGMAPSLTNSSSGKLTQTILNATDFDTVWRGVPFSLGCWVRSNTASVAKITIDDGDTTQSSDPHTGGNAFEWLTVTKTLTSGATKLQIDLESLSASALTYFDFPTLIIGEIAPRHPIDPRAQKGTIFFPSARGDAVTGTRKHSFRAERPFIVTNVSLIVKTAPTGQALIVDVNHDLSGTPTSMFSTRPQIAISAKAGGANPDSTYRYRCFQGVANDGSDASTLLTVDVDQVGSSVKGEDLDISIRTLQFIDPFEVFRSATSIGNE